MKAKDVLAIWVDWRPGDSFYVVLTNRDNESTGRVEMMCHEFMASSLAEHKIKSFGRLDINESDNWRYYVKISDM